MKYLHEISSYAHLIEFVLNNHCYTSYNEKFSPLELYYKTITIIGELYPT